MAGSVNKCIIIGNLGKDPDVRRTQDGRPIVNLTVATSDDWKDKTTGERKSRVEWHRVVIFNEGLCRVAESYLKKGAKVYIEGQLQTRKWQKDGQDHYSTEIVLQGFNHVLTMLDGPGDRQQGGGQAQAPGGGGYGMGDPNQGPNDKPADGYGAQSQQGSGGFGGGTAGGGRFDKDLDDEIPFVFKEIATPWDTV
jgi:single-strand DNA-binding protein